MWPAGYAGHIGCLASEQPSQSIEPADMPASLLRCKRLGLDLLSSRLQRRSEDRSVTFGSPAPVDQCTHLIGREDDAGPTRRLEEVGELPATLCLS